MAVRLSGRDFHRLGGDAPAPRPKRGRPEAALLADVLEYLTRKNVWHERRNAGCVYVNGRRIRLGTPGTPDVLVIHQGRALWLELKSPAGRQRPSQRAFQAGVEGAGCVYLVVRSLGELIEALQREAVIGCD